MIPVAAPTKGVKKEIRSEKTAFAVASNELKKSSASGFYPNTIGTYRNLEKRAQKQLKKALKDRQHGA